MLLAIDIGNTNIVMGVWNGQDWLLQWRLRTVRDRTVDEHGIYLKGLLNERQLASQISSVIICSVVPRLTQTWFDVSGRYLNQVPLIVDHTLDLGIQNKTDIPSQVGADRLVNAAAAYNYYNQACIVVDMGTATKFDVISSDGALLGGVISPGLQITADALFQRAAKLSQVDLEAPPKVIGQNTIHAIQSGLIFGYLSLIEGLLPKLKAELRETDPAARDVPIHVIGTGGLINLLGPHTDVINRQDPWLTLTGLKLIAKRNQS